MDNRSATPNNIVAAAISTANIALTPSSPKRTNIPVVAEMSPQPQHMPLGSPVHLARSPHKQPSTESMEVTDQAASPRHLMRQRSQDSDTPSQRSMDSSQTMISSPYRVDEPDETVVMRTDGKAPHLVTITPPANSYMMSSLNGDSRMQHLMVCSNSTDKSLMTPMNMQYLTKTDSTENDLRTKPKDDTTYPITCGNNKAELVWKKFICPGINAKCVKCGDSWFTPKEFVNFAGKSTLKDWKRAIRINGVMLRRQKRLRLQDYLRTEILFTSLEKMIENNELNYYEHETNCSNQCRSNKSSSFDNSCEKPSGNSFESDGREHGRDQAYDYPPARSSSEDIAHLANKKISLPALQTKSQEGTTTIPANHSLERSSSEDSGLAASPHLDSMLLREAPVTVEKIQDLNNFWNGILRMDLFDDIIRDVMIQVTNLQSRTRNNGSMSIEDVVSMTNLINSLEMIPIISSKISLHKRKVEKETEESSHLILELEKKLAEQKKYDQDLKRKSQHLENVISLTPTEKRQKRIYRIGRQKAVDTRIPPVSGVSSSPVPGSLRENVLMGSVPGRGGIGQRELWPQTIQVDANARAASSQMARMNVSGTSGQSSMPAIPSFAIFSPHQSLHSTPEVFASSPLHQAAFMTSSAHHSSREGTQSPKK